MAYWREGRGRDSPHAGRVVSLCCGMASRGVVMRQYPRGEEGGGGEVVIYGPAVATDARCGNRGAWMDRLMDGWASGGVGVGHCSMWMCWGSSNT